MAAKCTLTNKGRMSGNNVSHSQRKTKRTFAVNIQNVSLYSEALGKKLKIKIATSTLRSIEHNGGIDSYLLNASAKDLTDEAKKLKKQIKKALEGSKETGSKSKASKEEAAKKEAA